MNGIQEVDGSIPFSSTNLLPSAAALRRDGPALPTR
jgi:hypothetical protein